MNSLSNLRPISILCALSKAFEKLLESQMSSLLTRHNLLSEHQTGFRKSHSIKPATLRVYDIWAAVVDKRGSAVLVLLDFSKAFDIIPHGRLCTKLETQFCFSSGAVNLLESCLEGRTQTVYCEDRCLVGAAVTSGVPQGSVIGLLLFSCYINDLPTVLKCCSIQMYADNVQLYVGRLGPCTRELVNLVSDDLRSVVEWSKRNGLLVNHSKSKAP